MYQDKVNLLDQCENEHCRTHKRISYQMTVFQHPFTFYVKGSKNLNENNIKTLAHFHPTQIFINIQWLFMWKDQAIWYKTLLLNNQK